jgi:hypothetical protein
MRGKSTFHIHSGGKTLLWLLESQKSILTHGLELEEFAEVSSGR